MRNFKSYSVWQDGLDLYTQVFEFTSNFPKAEIYGLTSQMRRAALSIPSNIAEGCSRSSTLEFSRFLEIATGSLFELETQMIAAHRVSYLNENDLEEFEISVRSVRKQLLGLRRKVKPN